MSVIWNYLYDTLGMLFQPCTSTLVAWCGLWMFFSLYRTRRRKIQYTGSPEVRQYKISTCPNPDCVRCRKYKEVNVQAQKLLPRVWDNKNTSSTTTKDDANMHLRVREAVEMGPELIAHEKRRQTDEAPHEAQFPTVLLVRGLLAKPVVTSFHQKACLHLEQHVNEIRKEYELAFEKQRWLANDVDEGAWHVLHLLNQGVWQSENTKEFPLTTQLVRSLPNLLDRGCIFGNVFFSVVEPGTAIEPHCGPCNVRHRLHLTLHTRTTQPTKIANQQREESGASQPLLHVCDEAICWNDGKAFVFDDSLVHSVEYPFVDGETDSDEEAELRVVLIADLWHHDLSAEERRIISLLYHSGSEQ